MSKKHQAVVAMNLESGKFSAKCKAEGCGFESQPANGYGTASKAATGHANKK